MEKLNFITKTPIERNAEGVLLAFDFENAWRISELIAPGKQTLSQMFVDAKDVMAMAILNPNKQMRRSEFFSKYESDKNLISLEYIPVKSYSK